MRSKAYDELVQSLLETLHENTKETYVTFAREPARAVVSPEALPGDEVLLPPIEPSSGLRVPLQRVIQARVSIRSFQRRLMPIDLVGRLIHAVAGAELLPDPRSDPRGPLAPLIDLYAFLWEVEGLEAGTYRYDSIRHALIRTGKAPSRRESAKWTFQPELARGTGLLLFIGDFDAALGAFGQRGYRYLLMQAGLMGEAAYLVGTALGLGICGNGGLRETTVQELGGLDGLRKDLLWSVAFGFPVAALPISSREP